MCAEHDWWLADRRSSIAVRASSVEHRTSRMGTTSVGNQAQAAPMCGSISTGVGMLRRQKLFRGLRRGQSQALAQIIVEAWPHEQTAGRLSSSLGVGGPLGGADGVDRQNPLFSSQAQGCAEKGLRRRNWPTGFRCDLTASLGLAMKDGPVLWDAISNETAKVGSSHLCMLVDTLQPRASARCGGGQVDIGL